MLEMPDAFSGHSSFINLDCFDLTVNMQSKMLYSFAFEIINFKDIT